MTSPLRVGRRPNAERINAAIDMLAERRPVEELAAQYGVRVDTLKTWHDAALRALQMAFAGIVKDNDARTETIAGLMRENTRLREELRALKKTAAAASQTCHQLAATLASLEQQGGAE